MDRELISVIIPVYRVEPYLEKCVQSVLEQSYVNLEVILADDGSPDDCPAICDAFAARDSRVRVIHKPNGGQGSARNAGLDMARGRYIGFVDSDDAVRPDMYEKLWTALTEADADVSICDIRHVDEAGAVTVELPALEPGVVDQKALFRRLETAPGWWRYATPVNRLYKRELLEGVRFPEDRLYEDAFIVAPVYARCRRAAVIPDQLYLYLQRAGSVMRTDTGLGRLDGAEAFRRRYDFYRERGWEDLASAALGHAYTWIWQALMSADVWRDREKIAPYMAWAAGQLLRRGQPRGLLLMGLYAMRTVRCMLAGPGRGRG